MFFIFIFLWFSSVVEIVIHYTVCDMFSLFQKYKLFKYFFSSLFILHWMIVAC